MNGRSSISLQAVSSLSFAVILWGIQPLAMRVVLFHFSPYFTAASRAFIAALIFGIVAYAHRHKKAPDGAESDGMSARYIIWIIVGGLALGISSLSWNASLLHTTVGACSVLQLCSSIILALYGIIFLSERCPLMRAIGLLLSMLGMFLVSWNGSDLSALVSSRYFKGNVLALVAGSGWAVCALAQMATARGRTSSSVVAPMFAVNALLCSGFALSQPTNLTPFNTTAFIYIVLTGALGLGLANQLFTQSMRSIPASIGAAILTVSPAISVIGASLLLNEPLTPYIILGTPLTCIGVALAVLQVPVDRLRTSSSIQTADAPSPQQSRVIAADLAPTE